MFPFIVFTFLLVFKKMPLTTVSIITLVISVTFTLLIWKILPIYLLNSFVKGFLTAFDIFVTIFGAIFFFKVLQQKGIIEDVSYYLESFCKDYRVQVIILAWLLESFIEGTAGFGTPCAVVAPLLVGIGFSPLDAVILSLMGNSVAGVFGAAGTPIRVGFWGLSIEGVPEYAGIFNLAGILIPVFMLWHISSLQKNWSEHFKEVLPFAIWSGVAFSIPSLLFVKSGQEFSSILGSLVGLVLVFVTTKLGIFAPKNIRTLREKDLPIPKAGIFRSFAPYLLLIVLLIVGKYTLGSFQLEFPWGLVYSWNLFNPGWLFLLAGMPFLLFEEKGEKFKLNALLKSCVSSSFSPFVVVFAMSTLVQLMLNSAFNSTGLISSLQALAKLVETPLLPLLAPFVGAFGSFVTGSVTVSNVLFGSLLNSTALALKMNTSKILALSLVGGAAGNMISLADMLSAEAVVGLKNQSQAVLKGVILPCFIYIAIAGVLGLLL